jgi:hypothetical protein
VVEQSTHDPKFKGSNPAVAVIILYTSF